MMSPKTKGGILQVNEKERNFIPPPCGVEIHESIAKNQQSYVREMIFIPK